MLLKLKNDLKNIQERSNIYQNNDDDLGLEQENDKLEWEMSRRRVNTLTREYEMLNFTYSGSSILFKEIWLTITTQNQNISTDLSNFTSNQISILQRAFFLMVSCMTKIFKVLTLKTISDTIWLIDI